MPIQWFYSHRKRMETDRDILQILEMVQNPSNSPHLEKKRMRALSSASCCNYGTAMSIDARKPLSGAARWTAGLLFFLLAGVK